MYLFKHINNTTHWIGSYQKKIQTISRIQKGDYLSDHCTITWTHKVEKQPIEKINHTSRNVKSINEPNFASDLAERLSQLNNIYNLQILYEGYIKTIISTLDQHAPEITKKRTKETAKIMVCQRCSKIEKTMKNGRKNLAKN